MREHKEISVQRRTGTLYLVGTPIGNPDDLSLRALATLRRVSLIVAEHPAVTQALLAHHQISTSVTSYGPHNLGEKVSVLIERLQQGQDLAFVVDCGMPVIHDPGQLLIEAAHRQHVPVTLVPGPSVATAALALSGRTGDRFYFIGELSNRGRSWLKIIEQTCGSEKPIVALVSPHTLSSVLRRLARSKTIFQIVIAANMTRTDECVLEGTATSLLSEIGRLPRHADLTLVLNRLARRTTPRSESRKKTATRRRAGG